MVLPIPLKQWPFGHFASATTAKEREHYCFINISYTKRRNPSRGCARYVDLPSIIVIQDLIFMAVCDTREIKREVLKHTILCAFDSLSAGSTSASHTYASRIQVTIT